MHRTNRRRRNQEHPLVTVGVIVLWSAIFWFIYDGFAERRAIEAKQRESIRLWEERD